MNRCPNCAAQNREGAKFCTSCGFRLPTEQPPVIANERSPFATTSTVPPFVEQPTDVSATREPEAESGFATWNPEPAPPSGPGFSWDAAAPQNTAVPVDDDMIARLVGESDASNGSPAEPAQAPDTSTTYRTTWEPSPTPRSAGVVSTTSVDHLLKLARDLEFGLIELADAPEVLENVDSRLLANALADLQDEDDLTPLRSAVATAQERPRDVDVMLDLVLRADAIAAVMTERDQLRSAISLFLESGANAEDDVAVVEDEPLEMIEAEVEVVDEPLDEAGDTSDLSVAEEATDEEPEFDASNDDAGENREDDARSF